MTGHISYSDKSFKGSTERHMKSLRRAPANKAMVFRFEGRAWTISECLKITGMDEDSFRKRLRALKARTAKTVKSFTLGDFKV
jgi:uncharacterized Fe-S cluster-containing radical SAM superfamily protein